MSIPLLLFVIGLVTLVISLHQDNCNSTMWAVITGLSIVLTFISFMFGMLSTNHQWDEFEPTSYTTYETPREVIAVTTTETFTTKSVATANDWKSSHKGWIVKSYNYFGVPAPEHKKLTTENPNDDQ